MRLARMGEGLGQTLREQKLGVLEHAMSPRRRPVERACERRSDEVACVAALRARWTDRVGAFD